MIFSTGDRNRPPTYEDTQQMTYLERVIKETLRLFPPLPIIGRKLDQETKIGKYVCPAGNAIIIYLPVLYGSPTRNSGNNIKNKYFSKCTRRVFDFRP